MGHSAFHIISVVVIGSSVLYTILPPFEVFNDFPRFQKYYKVIVYTVKYIGLNARSVINPSIQTAEGTKVSDAASK